MKIKVCKRIKKVGDKVYTQHYIFIPKEKLNLIENGFIDVFGVTTKTLNPKNGVTKTRIKPEIKEIGVTKDLKENELSAKCPHYQERGSFCTKLRRSCSLMGNNYKCEVRE